MRSDVFCAPCLTGKKRSEDPKKDVEYDERNARGERSHTV